jgi:hypothetical protein
MAEAAGDKPVWRIDVDAGPHARRHLPIGVPIEDSIIPADDSLPWLDREGRQRTIPCQIEVDGAGRRLWWIISEMEPGERDRYTLSFDRRERSSPIRWRVEKTTQGWSLAEQDLRVLDLVTSRHRPATVALAGPTGPLAKINPPPFGVRDGEKPFRRMLAREPIVVRGPVFARMNIACDVRGDHDLLMLREEIDVRVFPGQKGTRLVDLEIAWQAVAKGLTLSSNDRGCWPTAIFELEKEPSSIRGGTGRAGSLELDGQVGEWIQIEQGLVRFIVIARGSSFGLPSIWRFPQGRVIQVMPTAAVGVETRLAIGEECRQRFRLIVMPTVGRSFEDVLGMAIEPICRWRRGEEGEQ